MKQDALVKDQDLKALADFMNQKYQYALRGRFFEIAAEWVDHKEIVAVTVTLQNKDQSFVYPVEGFIKYKEEDLSPQKAALFLIDYIDLYFDDYFQDDENLFIPIAWAKYQYDAVDFYLRGQVFNQKLEKMADKFLEEHGVGKP